MLDIHALERMGLGQSFAQFDMSAITPTELGLVSKNLYALGLIDKTTANLMVVAGTSLDAMGNQTHPDQKMNALDFFSARIHSLRTAGAGSNEYGFHVVPDYIKTVHVLQNLDDFAQAQRSQRGARSAISGQVNIVKNHAKGISVKV
ncbi:hypothetical protein [Pseudomonas sp. NPDC090201]|uniref:hypothetical protein n=1 Tax=Pseudomonas sp. NPDC090201 TaxID=3364475 RepID=UPI0037FF72A2